MEKKIGYKNMGIWKKSNNPSRREGQKAIVESFALERLLSHGLEVYSEGQQVGSKERRLVMPVAERSHPFTSPGLKR